MSELILHHYPTSPFAEKVRLMLGYKKLTWKSVIIPAISPKPDLVALTGGYRKTPVLQIGADIYCDTALISDVLEHVQPDPSIYPEPSKGMGRTLAHWADNALFWTAMGYNMQSKGIAQMFSNAPPDAAKAFGEDRKAMNIGVARTRPADAAAAYRSFLRRVSDMLDDWPYLLGEAPCIADFSMYHPLWFTRNRTSVLASIFNATPSVLDWMDRMSAIGHGQMERFSAVDAIAVAAAATPAPLHDDVFQDEHGIPLGSRVTVSSDSFGPELTEGELIAATRMHYTLRREGTRAGLVHVHFPRIGYQLKTA